MSNLAGVPAQYFVPSPDIFTSIVIPTIIFCIGLIVIMLIGINRCKQWELDKIVEIRRTRRVIRRITERLREANFNTIQKARHVRNKRRASSAVKASAKLAVKNGTLLAPPSYSANVFPRTPGSSPPPAYEDTLLDQLYYECLERKKSK